MHVVINKINEECKKNHYTDSSVSPNRHFDHIMPNTLQGSLCPHNENINLERLHS